MANFNEVLANIHLDVNDQDYTHTDYHGQVLIDHVRWQLLANIVAMRHMHYQHEYIKVVVAYECYDISIVTQSFLPLHIILIS